MNKIWILLSALAFSCGATAQKSAPHAEPVFLDKAIRFEIPFEHVSSEAVLKALLPVNIKLIYVASITAEGGGKPMMFSVSKYVNNGVISIQDAFEETVRFRPDVDCYTLVDYGTEQMGGKTLRYKISSVSYDGTEVTSIMYYFMKDDASGTLYELKIACHREELEKYKKVLQTVALPLSFVG